MSRDSDPPIAKRLEYLDSSRAIGALIVAAQHFGNSYPLYDWTDFVFNGKAAVSFFFVLSGYVLSHRHVLSARLELDLPRYLVTRFARLWLPYAGALFVALLLQRYVPHIVETAPSMSRNVIDRWASIPGPKQVSWELDPRHFFSPDLVAPSWTLMAELVASILLPIYLLLIRQSFLWFALFLCFSYLGNSNGAWILGFAMGVALARNMDAVTRNSSAHNRVAILLVFGASYAFNLPGRLGLPEYLTWDVLSVGFMAVLLTSPRIQSVGNHAIPAYLGRISFGIYLLHWPVLCSAAPMLLLYLNRAGIRDVPAWWLSLPCILALSIAAASLFYFLVERTSIYVGRQLGAALSWIVRRAIDLIPSNLRTPPIKQ